MRFALTLALLLVAAAAPRDGCGNGTPPAYDACAGKNCGDACTVCRPDDRDCAETAVVKACDPFHRCVPKVDGMCQGTPGACTGKACGAECVIDPPCRSATPPCMMPSVLGHCDQGGICVAGLLGPGFCAPAVPVTSCAGQACGVPCELPCPAGATCDPTTGWCAGDQCWPVGPPCPAGPPPPSWGCVGKACGDSCGVCPEGTDPSKCPVPTFAATACDAQLQCVTVGTFTCSAEEACRGKACGAACETCPACMRPYAMACDASAACVPVPVMCGP